MDKVNSRNNSTRIFLFLLFSIGGFICCYKKCSNNKPQVSIEHSNIDSLLSERQKFTDSLLLVISDLDSVINHQRDSIKANVTYTNTIINRYYTITDTSKKIQYCDTIIKQYVKLSKKCSEMDSLNMIQKDKYEKVVSTLQYMVDTCSAYSTHLYNENAQLKDKNKRLKKYAIGASITSAIETFIIAILIRN